ncbi:hypothetical protein DPEC_G00235860 [Dallia pectoralis]|uniref:Uncharacterized protein n=1 Tax=Dallia pectoralis TaxID=75939 RepID=A0ACC2FY38_DALPE|nr:hypothetical protein DPEC_G00235860 [Dallia pectoralis]
MGGWATSRPRGSSRVAASTPAPLMEFSPSSLGPGGKRAERTRVSVCFRRVLQIAAIVLRDVTTCPFLGTRGERGAHTKQRSLYPPSVPGAAGATASASLNAFVPQRPLRGPDPAWLVLQEPGVLVPPLSDGEPLRHASSSQMRTALAAHGSGPLSSPRLLWLRNINAAPLWNVAI